jgi:hypothetical protein
MSDRVVVYSATPECDHADRVAARLRAGGVEIIDEQPHMLLVSGPDAAISKALDAVSGWSVTGLTEVPHPPTREKARRRPTKA